METKMLSNDNKIKNKIQIDLNNDLINKESNNLL